MERHVLTWPLPPQAFDFISVHVWPRGVLAGRPSIALHSVATLGSSQIIDETTIIIDIGSWDTLGEKAGARAPPPTPYRVVCIPSTMGEPTRGFIDTISAFLLERQMSNRTT